MRISGSGGSDSPVSSAAMRLAMRRAAATRKWPEPQAGSQTVRSSSAATFSSAVPWAVASSSRGSRAESRRHSTRDGGRVVGARLLALVAGKHRERVGAVVRVVVGDQLQQGLVDAAEFFRAEVAEVDAAHRAAVAGLDQGQGADRAEEGLVGQAGACQGLVQGEGAAVVAAGLEDAADAGQGQLGDAAFGAEAVEDEPDGLEEVGVAGAALPAGQVAEPGSGEVLVVAVAGLAEPRPRFRGNAAQSAFGGAGISSASRSSATNQKRIRYTRRSSARLRSSRRSSFVWPGATGVAGCRGGR